MSNKITIDGTEIFETERGAKCAAARRGYSEGARILTCPQGFILLSAQEGFAGSTKGYNLMQSAKRHLWLDPHKIWTDSNCH